MLGSITGTAQRHWRLQEAEYLLELAHQHLIMRSDLRGTESLLLTADAILRQLNEPTLANVRTALAGDIARLRASEEPDVVGLHGRLTALIDLLDEVPLRTPAGFAAHSTATALATEEDKRKGPRLARTPARRPHRPGEGAQGQAGGAFGAPRAVRSTSTRTCG